ncbi:MAG TPA: glucose-6-phosphate dehydrogenase, partial [Paenibacillus sp.]|nr:glucose-6-phosphate dehydrogenase [Paenibacillus sp.]
YLEEEKVPAGSKTETYFAAKIYVDNFRWAGVPFYVRTGKRLPAKATEVVVEFKNVPENVYLASKHTLQTNLLVFRVNPMEGVYIKFNAKAPGSEERIVPVAMDFCHSRGVGINTPEAYERLIYDAVRGDSTYFTRWDEVAAQWRFVDRIATAWNELTDDLQTYPAGTWGPEAAARLLERDGHRWWPVNGQRDEDQAIRLCTDVPATN